MSDLGAQPHRYLGLELAGAKNPKTTLAVIEHYPKENKSFVLDIHEKIGSSEDESSDETLLAKIHELVEHHPKKTAALAVNVPLEVPACLPCTRKCPMPPKCSVPAVRWMREAVRKASRSSASNLPRIKEFTPYTQRPVELWIRYHVFPEFSEKLQFDIDETLGGNKAPLTARMQFLKRHLRELPTLEVWPKLTISCISSKLKLSNRVLSSYRKLEEGAYARTEIIDSLSKNFGIFIYEKDARILSQNLSAFDAFICAYTALLAGNDLCAKPPKGFPAASGWVHYPE